MESSDERKDLRGESTDGLITSEGASGLMERRPGGPGNFIVAMK